MIRKIWVWIFLSAALFLGACTTNPATGEQDFTPFMSPEDEAQIGKDAHPKILKAYGGIYEDEKLGAYIAGVTMRIARASDLPDIPYTVSVLDSPVVNAFALPGGYVYVTRGLLALANSEAEVAGVLGHEIGHVAARHSAQRHSAAVGSQILGAVLGAVTGSSAASQVFGMGAQGVLASYSRDQEFEADSLGVRYLTRAGYDPDAQAAFLDHLAAETALQAKLTNQDYDAAAANWLASHPATAERVARAHSLAAQTGRAGEGDEGREVYLRAIDGMLYGDRPEEGVVREGHFLHPGLKFRFDAPQGFHLQNTPQAVWAFGPDKSVMKFDMGKKPPQQDIVDYLTRDWARQVQLEGLERLSVNGMTAASGWTRLQNRRARIVAIDGGKGRVFRFLAGTLQEVGTRHDAAIAASIRSFRLMSEAEAKAVKPLRIRTLQVRAGDTVSKLARRMAYDTAREERFRVLNGLEAGEELRAGTRVKVVAE